MKIIQISTSESYDIESLYALTDSGAVLFYSFKENVWKHINDNSIADVRVSY